MKHCILEDSSFLVATIDPTDLFHRYAVLIFKKIIENKKEVKVVIPTLVFYETIITLVKRGGIPKATIEKKLWDFLFSDLVLNVALIETSAFRVCKKLSTSDISTLKTQDFIIANVGMEYEASILTFDKRMRTRVGSVYPDIYYCASLGLDGNSMPGEDETPRFLADFYTKLGKKIETFDDIPF
ncbi:MAG TPA: PIN domain-containing protein [bacterium]|nr:PIN domain-containing protein [bacterium]